MLSVLYPWIKAFHIIAVVTWMAGLFYLPRLFVYHAERAEPGSEMAETFAVMERKLLRVIMNPAMIATWALGLVLVFTPGVAALSDGWLHVKLAAVVALTVLHHWLALRRKEFAEGRNTRSGRTYRIVNEVPTLLLLIIVIMVVVKPF
ncbi:protoporphyrinogen oxidase HemJ [Rhodobacteraceae bacterium 2CG4]|uniref:Protoporphyrinogen IX oxidase n=1 Tax=Halovulum marinum TaxID=2662447 RepID=A0A6L5Z3W8_9RHOB|nr:protoporphyrinogen oxidase HemJ [Halovulum marinum]MSU90674.1 protoporphyrinogen oxidase HemJ [Halovulum marinum]